MRILLRQARSSDIEAMANLFRETVKAVNAGDYTPEEIEDWVACGDNRRHWEELLQDLYFVVAEVVEGKSNRGLSACKVEVGQLVGFTSMSDEGYLHSMFVHKSCQRCGIATILLRSVEGYALTCGAKEISSEVSITARHFFESQGYKVVKAQVRKAKNLELKNFLMVKAIGKNHEK